jgi:hypothetical protein
MHKIRNSKSEIRNKFEIQNLKIQNKKIKNKNIIKETLRQLAVVFFVLVIGILNIRICFEFRISDFGFKMLHTNDAAQVFAQ